LLHAIYDRITVAGPDIVGVRLTQTAYAPGLALALPEQVALARPTGVGRALATYVFPIEGRDERLAAVDHEAFPLPAPAAPTMEIRRPHSAAGVATGQPRRSDGRSGRR
jgi:hypothetical protein